MIPLIPLALVISLFVCLTGQPGQLSQTWQIGPGSAQASGHGPHPQDPIGPLDATQLQALVTEARQRSRVVIVTYWATWCGPCKEEIPSLIALRASRPESDLAMIAVSLDFDPSQVRTFIEKNAINYQVVLARESVMRDLAISEIPRIQILDRSGLKADRAGLIPPQELDSLVSRALKQ